MILHFDTALQKINGINWNIQEVPKKSHYVLLAEYLRRMAIFTKPYSTNQSPMGSPLNVLNIENNNLLLEIDTILEESLSTINNPIHYKICRNYLEAAYIIDKGILKNATLLDIYEPIIKFFERGGKLRFDSDRAFSCGSAAFVLNDWINFHSSRLETDISDLTLEKIDINKKRT